MKNITRREALRWIGWGAASLSLPSLWSCASRTLVRATDPSQPFASTFADISPVDRSSAPSESVFSGDNPDRAHALLWRKEAHLPRALASAVEEEAGVVIVGGGLSGLFTAYLLRDLKPILLERSPRFGGNARGESWEGTDYSIGAAYFVKPEEGSDLHRIYAETGVLAGARSKTDEDPVLFRGRLYRQFLGGESDPARRAHFAKVEKLFRDFARSRRGRVYPVIPPTTKAELASVRALDRENFLQFLEREINEPLHPHLRALLECYCWSSMGSGMQETSAALGVYFFAGEFDEVLVTPGGNAFVAERLLEKLHRAHSEGLRPSSVVLDAHVEEGGALVSYEDAGGKMRRIRAQALVMACPKFVAGKILRGIEPRREAAIREMRYTPYLVANVLLRSGVPMPTAYDTFLLGDGQFASGDIARAARARGATDLVSASYARPGAGPPVLTLYRPLPYTEARAEIYAPTAFARAEAEFRAQLEQEILPGLGYLPKDVAGMRLARWGHPLPRAFPGFYRGGTAKELQRPHRGRVFFVQQDNWACPALETGAAEALRWAPQIREVARG